MCCHVTRSFLGKTKLNIRPFSARWWPSIRPDREHLVEELAGIIWRKRRLRMAEAPSIEETYRFDATAYNCPDHVAGAALLPITGDANGKASIPRAIAAAPASELRDLHKDQAMTQRSLNILLAGGPGAYERALAALRDDTRVTWEECLTEDPEDGLTYARTAEALQAWISQNWQTWYERPIAELQHRDAIRDQALGVAYAANDLDVPARYEVHLDRKLEKTLAMLIRLRDLRRPSLPG